LCNALNNADVHSRDPPTAHTVPLQHQRRCTYRPTTRHYTCQPWRRQVTITRTANDLLTIIRQPHNVVNYSLHYCRYWSSVYSRLSNYRSFRVTSDELQQTCTLLSPELQTRGPPHLASSSSVPLAFCPETCRLRAAWHVSFTRLCPARRLKTYLFQLSFPPD